MPLPSSQLSQILKSQRQSFPWLAVLALIVSLMLAFGGYFLFTKPKAAPSQILFEKLFPAGSLVRDLGKIDLDVDSVLQNKVFKSLSEHGQVPIILPPLGKANPFIDTSIVTGTGTGPVQ